MKCRLTDSKECEITYGCNSSHIALDIVNIGYTLSNIHAHSDGVVVAVRNNCNKTYNNERAAINDWGDSYGNYVLIKHDKLYTFYAHMVYNSIKVKVGDHVKAFDVIGYMGQTGNANGGHLHFEVRTGESWTTRIDPTPYFNEDLAISLPTTVSRDVNKNQVEVIVSDLNVREGPSTSSKVVYYPCKKGIYDYLDEKDGWYKINENMWINDVGLKVYAKDEIVIPNGDKEDVLLWLVELIVKVINKVFNRN